MSDRAAFKATFAGLRSLADGDYRLSFDVPGHDIKNVMDILTHGGVPSAAKGTWFAIARLNNEREQDGVGVSPPNDTSFLMKTENHTEGAVRNPLAMRAALRCNDPEFRMFLEKKMTHMVPRGCHINTEKEAAMVVRSFCRVDSRSHIVPGSDAADRWENLDSQFVVWKNEARYVEAPRV